VGAIFVNACPSKMRGASLALGVETSPILTFRRTNHKLLSPGECRELCYAQARSLAQESSENRLKKIERLLREGEEIQISKRRRVIARLVPESVRSATQMPDFQARLRSIYGERSLQVRGADGSGSEPLLKIYADASVLVSLSAVP